MNNEKTEAGLASDLNRELDATLAVKAFDDGCLAFEKGMNIKDCPYSIGSEMSKAWRLGYSVEDIFDGKK